MGDRTYCALTFWKGTHVGEYQTLMQTITNLLGYPEFHSGTPNNLGFEEVNWGLLPSDIEADLRNRGFSYIWEWEAGGSYPAGITMYDATSGTDAGFTVIDGNIVLHLYQASDPVTLANAKNWDSWNRKPKTFAVIDSPSDDFLINLACQKEAAT